jgi:hypothetical protein
MTIAIAPNAENKDAAQAALPAGTPLVYSPEYLDAIREGTITITAAQPKMAVNVTMSVLAVTLLIAAVWAFKKYWK